jgi:RNA polymerase sigma-70 factor (ECF subfamily)
VEHSNDNRPGCDPRSDEQLVAALNDGDADAFEPLYRRHRDWVAALALRFTGDHALAMDVLQETFLYLLKKFPGLVLTAQLKTFLYPAVRNLALAARRKAERTQSSEVGELALASLPAPVAASVAGTAELGEVLRALPDEQRETLWLRFVDGLSLGEIALALEIPLGTVKSRLHNALATLRRDPRTKQFFP